MRFLKGFNMKPFIIQGSYRLLKSNKKLPLIAGHKLLYSCNLRCKMCPFWRRKDEKLLDLNDEIKIMKKLADAGVIFMGFEGGEPLLRRDLPEILKESHDRFYTSLVTNGILLKNKIDSIRKNLDFLFVSIDGIGKVHDSIRGVEGAFEKSLEGIKIASQYVPTDISFTITNENMSDAIKIVKLAEELRVSVNFQVAYNYSSADKLSPDFIQLRSILEQLLELKKSEAPITNSREYFESIINSWYIGIHWECKPWLTINIDPQGRIVLPCYVLNEYNGSVYVWDADIENLWEEYDWNKYLSCNKCGLSCYLEPSLFSWSNLSMVKERIVNSMISLLTR